MLLAIINIVTSILGIIGFFCGIPFLIVIGGVMYAFETITGLVTGELRSLSTTILSSVVSITISIFNRYNVFHGWCFGLCVESIVLSFGSISFMAVFAFIKNKSLSFKGNTDISVDSKNDTSLADTHRERCEWAENILNGDSLEPVDVSDVIPDEAVVNKIIDEQASLFDFIESEDPM